MTSLEAKVGGDESVGGVSVACVEVPTENNEVVRTVIINQFGHLVHLALATTTVCLWTIYNKDNKSVGPDALTNRHCFRHCFKQTSNQVYRNRNLLHSCTGLYLKQF